MSHNRSTYIFYSFFPRILAHLVLIDFFQDVLINVSVLIYRALCETARHWPATPGSAEGNGISSSTCAVPALEGDLE